MPKDKTTHNVPAAAKVFGTTRWSVVLEAQRTGSDTSEALETLCRTYWYPLYCYARRNGAGSEDAQDLTQSFFATFLEKGHVARADRERGRFRSFLLASFKNFLTNEWRREKAARRGGGCEVFSFDSRTAENRYAGEGVHFESPDRAFDRTWAIAAFQQATSHLRDEYFSAGKVDLYDALKLRLWSEGDGPSIAELAKRLQLSEAAVKMAIMRLRRRFREALRQVVQHTVAVPADLDGEMRYLISLFQS